MLALTLQECSVTHPSVNLTDAASSHSSATGPIITWHSLCTATSCVCCSWHSKNHCIRHNSTVAALVDERGNLRWSYSKTTQTLHTGLPGYISVSHSRCYYPLQWILNVLFLHRQWCGYPTTTILSLEFLSAKWLLSSADMVNVDLL